MHPVELFAAFVPELCKALNIFSTEKQGWSLFPISRMRLPSAQRSVHKQSVKLKYGGDTGPGPGQDDDEGGAGPR